MTLPETDDLLFDTQDGVLSVTLNRPKARNALTLQMVRDLTQAFAHADAAPALRVLVVRGAGGHFCAGADVRDFARARAEPVTQARHPVVELNAAFGHLCAAFARVSLPTVCVIEGAVLGGGFGLTCASDVALAAHSASFGLPETSLGVVPAQIAPFLVERLGFSQAKRLALSGAKIDAQLALALGLVHEVVSDAAALDQALAAAVARFMACAPNATRATKRLLWRARDEAAETLIDYGATIFAEALTGPEGEEGTRAFLEKRAPAWQRRGG